MGCDVCGASFSSADALMGHKGGRRGQCGMSLENTLWAALEKLLTNAELVGRDEYHIRTDDYDEALALLTA